MPQPVGDNYRAPAVACAASVLRLLARSPKPISLAGIGRMSPYSKSLIYRVLGELTREGLVEHEPERGYCLGRSLLELGSAYLASSPSGVAISQHLRDLSVRAAQTVNLAALRGMEIVYLLKFPGPSSYVTISHVGGRVPANCVALGKALLAELPEDEVQRRILGGQLQRMTPFSLTDPTELLRDIELVREQGYAVDRDQAVQGRSGLAVVLESGTHEPVGLSISIDSDQFDLRRDDLLTELRAARDQIRSDMAARRAFGEPEWPLSVFG